MATRFDVIWIGTGQATMTVVPRLLQAGKTVAVIEGGKFGGTCVNYGCTPTKTLVASAYAMHLARRGDAFGFTTDQVTVDFSGVMEPQQKGRQGSSGWIEDRLSSLEGCQVYHGFGQLVDGSTVKVNEDLLEAETIVIHAGTRPRQPEFTGIDSVNWLTNETILDLDQLPDHLAIVGGSYIALEFAQVFCRLGSDVTLLVRGPRLLSREDEDVARAVEQVLTGEGIQIIRNCHIDRLTPDDGVTFRLQVDGQSSILAASHVVFALGRVPNSDRAKLQSGRLSVC